MTGRLPGLRPAELDPAQRAFYDDMAANKVPWAETAGARAIAEDGSLLGPFNPYDFTWRLTHNHAVDNATYLRAACEFGEASVQDMVVLAGPHLTVCVIVNASKVPVPVGAQPESSAP